MTPANPTGSERPEEGRDVPTNTEPVIEKSEQVRNGQKFCGDLCRDKTDNPFFGNILEYKKGEISKVRLQELFVEELKKLSPQQTKKYGLEGTLTDQINSFLQTTKIFENQFMYEVDHTPRINIRAEEELLDGCILTAEEEYSLSPGEKSTLRAELQREARRQLVPVKELNLFLHIPKYRKRLIKKFLPSSLAKPLFDETTLEEIHKKVSSLNSSIDPKNKKIKDAWSRMLGGMKIRDGESLQDAFARIQEEGTEDDVTADYYAFFNCADTIISESNKDTIRKFLVRSYLPTVSLKELQEVDYVATKKILAQTIVHEIEPTGDSERDKIIKDIRGASAKAKRIQGLSVSRIAVSKLDKKTQIKLLGQLSSRNRTEQMQSFYAQKPSDLGAQAQFIDYEEKFKSVHGLSPDDVMTHENISNKLTSSLGSKIKNIDKFQPGSMMTWTKMVDGKPETIGYYIIDDVLPDDADEAYEGGVKVRFLGSNQDNPPKLSPVGITTSYTGPQFFDYLTDCADDAEIDFISPDDQNAKLEQDGVSYYSDTDAHMELRERYSKTEIYDTDSLTEEINTLLELKSKKKEEDLSEENKKIAENMTFAVQAPNGDIDTFYVKDVSPGDSEDGTPGEITVHTGLDGKDSEKTYTFLEFRNAIEHASKKNTVFRIPPESSSVRFGVSKFNDLMRNGSLINEEKHKRHCRWSIDGKDGKMSLVEKDRNDSNPQQKTIVKVEGLEKKDLYIEGFEGDTVTVRMGTFTQSKDQKPAEFKGSSSKSMPLSWFWAYFQTHNCTLTKEEAVKAPMKKTEDTSMSWWNIFTHAHSFGTILHGDLWKAPWKAFEEQHQKDHAFAGKITAALAIEKLQKTGGGIGKRLFDYDWANIMIGDASNSFHSYLDELVQKIDGMGSYHRTRLIKKWSKLHFPDPKFMAAMMASMQVFGQLYPYDFDDEYYKNKDGTNQWYWYNEISHAIPGIAKKKGFPKHMPPHGEDKWPRNKGGNEMSEIEACQNLFGEFNHPMLKNLGRRFQKYAQKGHDNQISGGKGNLEERGSMEEKLDWMCEQMTFSRPTEGFGESTELWLKEGYPTEITTLPYALLLFGNREQQMLPKTAESIKKQFQDEGVHVPMFAFVESKTQGDIFRDVGLTMAYTISTDAGNQLKKLIEYTTDNRVKGAKDPWINKFKTFWMKYGKEMMHKMSGMKDPLLNLLINDSDTFDAMYDELPEGKKEMYARLKKGSEERESIKKYHKRLAKLYDCPSHVAMPRGKGFYAGDHFRFRDGFDSGFPIAWINWDAYWDENFTDEYGQGRGATKGDGVFNEIRGFLYAIPKMANEMVDQMGITSEASRKKHVNRICKNLLQKNIKGMRRLAKEKIKADLPAAEYVSMTATMLGIIPLKRLTIVGKANQERVEDYHKKMQQSLDKAEKMEEEDFEASVNYRSHMAARWSEIVQSEKETNEMTIEDIYNFGTGKNKQRSEKSAQDVKRETEAKVRKTRNMTGGNNIRPAPDAPRTDDSQGYYDDQTETVE